MGVLQVLKMEMSTHAIKMSGKKYDTISFTIDPRESLPSPNPQQLFFYSQLKALGFW